MNDRKVLESKFHQEMLSIYKRAKSECNYNATRFLRMLSEYGGLRTAKILLHSKSVSEGFTELWKCKRLDLTVEAHILNTKWDTLFSVEEKKIAEKRLSDLGYSID